MLTNWIRQTTTTTGTGNLTLSSVSGYPTFADWSNSRVRLFEYTILDDSTGQPIESGKGYLSGGAFVRYLVTATYTSGTLSLPNSTSGQVSLAAGTKRVIGSPDFSSVCINPPFAPIAANTTANKRLVMADNLAPATTAAFTLATNTLWAWPFRVAHRGNYDAFATRTSASGTNVDFGLYEMLGTGLPGDLIVSATGVAAAAGMIYGTFTAQQIPPGWYVMAINCSGGPSTYSQLPIDSCYGRSDTATAETVVYKTQTQGTLPNPYGTPGGIGYSFASAVPAIALRHV